MLFKLIDTFDWTEILKFSMVLFSMIDIIGSIPIIVNLRKKSGGHLHEGKATLFAGFLMVSFLFFGEAILSFLGVDVNSFSFAGSIVIFIIGMEMVLGREFFKDAIDSKTTSIVPLAFPLIAGTGVIATVISARAQYQFVNVLIGIMLNLGLVYIVLKISPWLHKKLGVTGENILRKFFGVILLAIAIKLFQRSFIDFYHTFLK